MKKEKFGNSWVAGLLVLLLLFTTPVIWAQNDSVVLKNGNVIVGEIKSLDKGVMIIGTSYSKNDFMINWSGIKEVYSKTRFIITLDDGKRIKGEFHSEEGGNKMVIIDESGHRTETLPENIVYLKGLKSDFWSRVHANIDLGLSVTKANDLRQYSVRSAVGYLADKWLLDIYYNDIRSWQDSVPETKRTESGISFTYLLPKDWFLRADIATLSNTEQALKLRFTGKLGAGKYIIHTNRSQWGIGAGLNINNETFTNEVPDRTSLEGYVGTELNLFNIGNLALISSLYVYPGLTESGRWRTDFKFDARYDLPLNLYIKLGLTLNYDNQPAIKGNETDYVYVIGVGWHL